MHKQEVERQLQAQSRKEENKEFDLADDTTFTIQQCPVGPYLVGKTFEEIQKILTDLNSTLPVCKKADGTVDLMCFRILYRTFISKDIDSIVNIILDSESIDHVVGLHGESDPPKSKEQ